MKTPTILLIALAIYLFISWRTFIICVAGRKQLDKIDTVLIPIVATLWPLFWGFVIGNEIVGFFRNRVAQYFKKRRIARKHAHHQERLKRMNS